MTPIPYEPKHMVPVILTAEDGTEYCGEYPKAVSSLKSERDSVPPGFGRDLKRALSHLIPEAKDFNRVGGCFCRGYHNIKLCEAP